jgi:hypothetical protein
VVGNDQAADPLRTRRWPVPGTHRDRLPQFEVRRGEPRRQRLRLQLRCYYEIIYVQGADYLNDYRDRVGNDAFWTGVRAYYDRYRFGLGGTLELLETLDEQAPEGSSGGHQDRFPSLFPPTG